MRTSTWRKNFEERPWYKYAYSLIKNKKNEKIIEFGSGLGEFAEKVRVNNNDLTCTDIDSGYINNLIKKGFKAKKADFNKTLDFDSSTFDGMICLEVIEHIFNAEFFLSEMNRILKKRGWVLLSTPNVAWFGYRLRFISGDVPPKEGYHLRFFSYDYLKKILEQEGFKIEKEASITPLPLSKYFFKRPLWLSPKIFLNMLAQDIIIYCRKI